MSQSRSMASRTMKSLHYLNKLHSCTNGSRIYRSSSSIKILCFMKNFSTLNSAATDESFDFQNPNGFSLKTSNGYHDSWYNESKENNNGVYRENLTGVHRNSGSVYGQSYNNPGSLGNEFKSNQDGNGVDYDKSYQDKILQHGSNQLYQESRNMQSSRMNQSNGMYQETRGNYNNGENGGFGQTPFNTNSQTTRNFDHVAGSVSGQHFDENRVRVNGSYPGNEKPFEPSRVFGQTPFNINSQNNRNFDHVAGSVSRQRFDENRVQVNGPYPGNEKPDESSRVFGQTPCNNRRQNTRTFDHVAGSGQHFDENNVPVNESPDESSRLNGTIEEFDAFCNEKKLKEAVEVLGLLKDRNVSLDISRYLFLLNECGESQALEEAKQVHNHLSRSVSHLEVPVCNKIMETYLKCGSIEDAFSIFNKMGQRNLTSWDTMITGLAKNNHGEEAIELFTKFKKTGLKPDPQMFFGVFTACSFIGDMKEGMLHLESMIKVYKIEPSVDHCLAIIDMLGSAGYLTESLEFIEKAPVQIAPRVETWEILMNHSRAHGDTELGDRCAELVGLLDPTRLDQQSRSGLLPIKTTSEATKEKRFNPLEAKTKVYEYRAGDTSHPETEKLYSQLRCLKEAMKEVGYVPETKFVLHDIDQESKEEALLSHSERLALSQALLTSPARSPVRIIKNLRVCGDCHNALKIISGLVGRLIVARDAKRFHHFENGVCSCGDYW